MSIKATREAAARRARRVRYAIRMKSDLLRLSVHRSNMHISAQIIDDSKGVTLAHASTLDKEYKSLGVKLPGKEAAFKIGEMLAVRAKAAGVSAVVFDKGSRKFHGRVAKIAEGARAGGLSV